MALNLNKEGEEDKSSAPQPEKKSLNLSKEETKPVSKMNLSKDPIEPAKDNAIAEKKESNLNTSSTKVLDSQPKKKSKTLLYSILGIVAIALVVFLFNNKKGETDTSAVETSFTETPVTETPVTETPVTETPVTETPVTENLVTEIPVVQTTVEQFESGTSIVSSPNDQQIKLIKDYLAKNASNKITLIGYASSEVDINLNKSL